MIVTTLFFLLNLMLLNSFIINNKKRWAKKEFFKKIFSETLIFFTFWFNLFILTYNYSSTNITIIFWNIFPVEIEG